MKANGGYGGYGGKNKVTLWARAAASNFRGGSLCCYCCYCCYSPTTGTRLRAGVYHDPRSAAQWDARVAAPLPKKTDSQKRLLLLYLPINIMGPRGTRPSKKTLKYPAQQVANRYWPHSEKES